jgi:hypothetical protein
MAAGARNAGQTDLPAFDHGAFGASRELLFEHGSQTNGSQRLLSRFACGAGES